MITRFVRAASLATAVFLPASATASKLEGLPCPNESVRVIVIGDSLADGIWGSLFRSFARCRSIDLVRLTTVSDGLAKSSATEWLERYAKVSRPGISEIAIVQIGANDVTTIRNGREREEFGTDAWRDIYSDRLQELASGLTARASTVIWYGLPVVGKSDLSEPYDALTDMQGTVAPKAGIHFLDIRSLTRFGGEGFTMNASVDGKFQQIRASDRVHFTEKGYDAVADAMAPELVRIFRSNDIGITPPTISLQ